ncbi:hypothetical protein B0H63DRAFT_391827 [Podospora didyma]|uniref:Uncharacterized protein n=1 Tax=Podospora didyma TaxID=330526 RepID=A0AAE0NRK1_9PEZI|nr:hypothetical protein B0H63DRAFT_391827 [Podospora didyma]
MAVRYSHRAVDQAADDDVLLEEETSSSSRSPFSRRDVASPQSPTTSISRSTTSPSLSHSTYQSMAEQTFTPLSMDSSDFCLSDGGAKSPAARETDGLLKHSDCSVGGDGVSAGMDGFGAKGPNTYSTVPAPSASTATTATTLAATRSAKTIVNARIQSFEALQSATAARRYDLNLAKNKNGHRHLGLVSPPSTVSPSPPPALGKQQTTSSATSPTFAKQVTTTATALNSASSPASPVLPRAAFAVAGHTTLIRPTPQALQPRTPRLAIPYHEQPLAIRTSSTASVPISHPTPNLNRRSQSGANLSNVAALEASAERLSMTSSIEDAIREAHNELKRSDSRRSSLLRETVDRRTSGSDYGSVLSQSQLSVLSRQSSIIGINNAARTGGYSPGGYVMSPLHSLSAASARLRSSSKAGSIGLQSPVTGNMEYDRIATDVGNGEDFPFIDRHGPGKSSIRSTASKLSLAQIAELDFPTGLTQEALDEADRAAAAGEHLEDDETIRASAHQHIEAQFADEMDDMGSPETEIGQPILDHGFLDEPAPRLQLHQPGLYPQYGEHLDTNDTRPTTSASATTYEQAQTAFGDFDGVHCDPEADGFPSPQESGVPAEQPQQQRREPRPSPPRRPASYFDPSTGQQMLYYPARVPAMLNLPPKLSKKPKAAAVRDVRRSQVMSAIVMPPAARESRVWLPDPVAHGSKESLPFMTGLLDDNLGTGTPSNLVQAPQSAEGVDGAQGGSAHVRQLSETSTIHPARPHASEQKREIRRPERLTAANKHKSYATVLEGLPPQLRADAFFELPPAAPVIEVKGGSAMATLDNILDASATAPVSAFTDHAFAGKLGSEVYGPERRKKKNKKSISQTAALSGAQGTSARNTVILRNSTVDLLSPPQKLKKRASHLSLLGGKRRDTSDTEADDHQTTLGVVGGEGGSRVSGSTHDDSSPIEQEPFSPNELAPSSEEDPDDDSEEEGSGDELAYDGPPTTLLAELQLRKQHAKLRTRPTARAYPNGMHSTLLELDAVAEVERKARKGKRVNLAWEDANANADHVEDLDDDDVPLGMLFTAKAVAAATGGNRSTLDISAVMNEVNRPLGLMERRELEDNEPLSRRRDRLQGRANDMPLSLDVMQKRMSQLTLTPLGGSGAMAARSQSRLNLPLQQFGPARRDVEDGEGEVEGESLAARRARLAAENPLPRARPVSASFTAELLSQFGGDLEDGQDRKDESGSTSANGVPEEEETLGQRRRRLQAEREARDREFATGGAIPRTRTPVDVDANRMSRRLSMGDLLSNHPLDTARGAVDPREQDRLRKETEAVKVQQEKDARMAAMRAQMPQMVVNVNSGARNGGYMNGRFNNGQGGATIRPIASVGQLGGYNGGMYNNGGMPMKANPAAYGVGYGAPMQTPQAHAEMVERWRRSVMP